jgi:peptidoglycan/xylan/chitin deacetylase (PgdA/CDA1 family)
VLSSGTYIRLKDHIALKINDFTGVTMAPIYKDASKLAPLLDPDLADRLMRAEEYSGNAKDQHGRFVSSSSKYSNIRVPEVSIALKRNMGELDYPNGRKFAIVLTHDIDLIKPSIPRSFISAARYAVKGETGEMMRSILWRRKGIESSPYLCSKEIIALEAKYGASSTFFFMAHGPDWTGAGYDPELVRNEMGVVTDGGCEVGLHGSFDAACSIERLRNEKERLQRVTDQRIRGYRNHYLRFNIPDTWNNLESAGFEYDSTLGFYDNVGFRDGMCYPYRPSDVTSERTINLWEIPLHVMDCALYAYMGASSEESWQMMERMIDHVESCNGMICLLWHNEAFSNPRLREWRQLYEKVLSEGNKKGAWMCGCSDLIDWWKVHAI